MARSTLASVACSDFPERTLLAPAKRRILNWSSGRSSWASSLKRSLARLRGKPFMDPDTSMTKMKSRSGMSWGLISRGGSSWIRKVFSSLPLWERRPLRIFCPDN